MKYSELFFLSSQTQSNLYNSAVLPDNENSKSNYSKRLLVFYLKPKFPTDADMKHKGEIIRISATNSTKSESILSNKSIHSVTEHLEFGELPATGEVVSIDTMYNDITNTLSICLGVIKKDTKNKASVYVYEYADYNDVSNLNKSSLAFKKDVSFNPLCIKHSKILYENKLVPCFLVSVSDEPISPISKDKSSPLLLGFLRQFKDITVTHSMMGDISAINDSGKEKKKSHRYFDRKSELDDFNHKSEEILNQRYLPIKDLPELKFINEKILYFDMQVRESDKIRIGLFGMNSGGYIYTVTDMSTGDVLQHFTGRHNSPITFVQLVHSSHWSDKIETQTQESVSNDYHALLCTAIEKACIFRCIQSNDGFNVTHYPSASRNRSAIISNQYLLKDSDEYDIVTCGKSADIDLDGELEILIGTYQHRVLVYKWMRHKSHASSGENKTESMGNFVLVGRLKCAGPVHSIQYEDITNDGLKEILVLTSRGLHIFQVDLNYVQDMILRHLSV